MCARIRANRKARRHPTRQNRNPCRPYIITVPILAVVEPTTCEVVAGRRSAGALGRVDLAELRMLDRSLCNGPFDAPARLNNGDYLVFSVSEVRVAGLVAGAISGDYGLLLVTGSQKRCRAPMEITHNRGAFARKTSVIL